MNTIISFSANLISGNKPKTPDELLRMIVPYSGVREIKNQRNITILSNNSLSIGVLSSIKTEEDIVYYNKASSLVSFTVTKLNGIIIEPEILMIPLESIMYFADYPNEMNVVAKFRGEEKAGLVVYSISESYEDIIEQIQLDIILNTQGKYLISGGVSWSGTGLVYDVSTLEYFFNGNKTSTATQVTLGASDPSNNRFDVVVVNEAGVVSVIQGTASASPEMPPIPETELMVSAILVEAGSVAPTILSEAIYLDNPTTNWTFSTYTTGSPTGTIIFNGTTTPKQGIHCIEANADQRLGARFIRSTSFDAYQYSMFSVWVRFTSAVAPNNALNVRFENSGGSLVGNTVNLFNFGLQRNIINTWQLVVIPLTSFGSLPATVKGIRMIMTGGTVGVPRQWDVDYMQLTNGSIPYANVPTIAFQKDGVGVGSASTLNIKEGANMTITPSVNPISGAVEYEFEATSSGGGAISALTPATATNTIDNLAHKQTWQWNSVTNGGGLLIDSNSTSAIAGEALVEIKRSGTITGFQKTVTLKLSNAIASISGNNPIALEIETIGNGTPIGINFKPSPVPGAKQINLEDSPNGLSTGISMGNQCVGFGGGGFTVIGTNGSSSMHYNCNGGSHRFGTTGSSKVQVIDYVLDASSPFTINRRTARPANDWELMFGGQFNTPSMLASTTETNSIRANAGVLSFAGDTGLVGGWGSYTPTYIMAIHGGTKNVGIGTITPNASALLDLESTTKGLAIPTMTSAQASAIASPKKSLMLYVTDTNGTFTSAGWWGYNGTVWKLILAE